MSRYDPDGARNGRRHVDQHRRRRPSASGSGWTSAGGTCTRWCSRPAGRRGSTTPADASGPIADAAREWGVRAAVGVPIGVEGRLWGVMVVRSTREEPLPADTEARLAGFTELVATAIANAEAQAALTASRARIVAAADATRRRIERDLHDGAQQRLVSLAPAPAQRRAGAVPPGADELTAQLDGVGRRARPSVLDELREIARGMHPALLAERRPRAGAEDAGPPLRRPGPPRYRSRRAAARADRARRLLRRGRGAHQRRQARPRHRHRGPGGRR